MLLGDSFCSPKEYMDRIIEEERKCRAVLSRNIKRFRSRLGLSQLNLALELNISPTFLSDIETGKKWVSPHTLALLAKALKIDIFELFKPEDAVAADASGILEKCLDDVAESVRKTVERSVMESVEESLQNIREYYLKK
jgi:transcriptional regulator with XRE-family HTH domain